MQQLSDNWFFEGLIDFEYKKYVLLAYLQMVDKDFALPKLYPHLAELVRQYGNLQQFLSNREKMQKDFPKELESFDTRNFSLIYKKVMDDDELIEELKAIVEFSLEKIKHYLDEGKEIYEFIEKQIQFSPVGVMPLNLQYGLMILRNGSEKLAQVYEYQVSIFESAGEKYRSIRTSYLSGFETSITSTYEKIKLDTIKQFNISEPPATYVFETGLKIPIEETLLPITKRMLAAYISTGRNA